MPVTISDSVTFRTLTKRVLPIRVKRVLRSIAFQMLDLSWELPSDVMIRIRNQSDWAIYNEIFVAGDYDPAISMAIDAAKVSGNLHILDLGANVGFFTLRCIEMARHRELRELALRITAIEGNPKSYRQLRERVGTQVDLPDFIAINGLVGKRNGTGAISDLEISGLNHVISDDSQRRHLIDYIDVEEVVGGGRVGLLKCDIEGSELVFLKNYPRLLERTEIAVLELHPQLCNQEECVSLLRAAGLATQRVLVHKPGVTTVLMAFR
jgi:FkbM family methyltransferase